MTHRRWNLVLVDHHDSFTYNLVHLFGGLGASVRVVPKESVSLGAARAWGADALILSPGPGHPSRELSTLSLVRGLGAELPMLGVCLGHQAIAVALGAQVAPAEEPRHGKPVRLVHDGSGLFEGLPAELIAGQYNSLAVVEASLPPALRVTARNASGEVMALEHQERPLWGVQFHPESVLSQCGASLGRNWFRLLQQRRRDQPSAPRSARSNEAPPASSDHPTDAPQPAGASDP